MGARAAYNLLELDKLASASLCNSSYLHLEGEVAPVSGRADRASRKKCGRDVNDMAAGNLSWGGA